jgi:hypothetical protein
LENTKIQNNMHYVQILVLFFALILIILTVVVVGIDVIPLASSTSIEDGTKLSFTTPSPPGHRICYTSGSTSGGLILTANSLFSSKTDNGLNTITPGKYINLPTISSGNGFGALLTILASSSDITSVIVTKHGYRYKPTDTLTVEQTNIPGANADLVFTLVEDDILFFLEDSNVPACSPSGNLCMSGKTLYNDDEIPEPLSFTNNKIKMQPCSSTGNHPPVETFLFNNIVPSAIMFVPTSGDLEAGTKVHLKSNGALSICYTTDGTSPSCSATTHTECSDSCATCNIILNKSGDTNKISTHSESTIKAVGCGGAYGDDGEVTIMSFNMIVGPVEFTPPSTTPLSGYTNNISLSSESSSSICYVIVDNIENNFHQPKCSSSNILSCEVGNLLVPNDNNMYDPILLSNNDKNNNATGTLFQIIRAQGCSSDGQANGKIVEGFYAYRTEMGFKSETDEQCGAKPYRK